MALEDLIAAPAAERKFTFNSLKIGSDEPVIIHGRHAGFSNPALSAAQLKAFNARNARRDKGGSAGRTIVTLDTIEADRMLDAKMFGQHVITKVENVFEDGKPLPQTPEKFEELLLAISKKRLDLFREYTGWATNADNFTDAPVGDPADLGK